MIDYIMDYLQYTFNITSKWCYITIYNFVDYAINNFNYSKDQLAYYLSGMIDELEFKEIKKVIKNYKGGIEDE